MVIGAGFFLLPSSFAVVSGAWSPWIILTVGLGMVPIALSFAEVGSRFTGNGGPYLYVRAAYGRAAGFEIGWVLWLSRVISHASVLAGLLVLIEVLSGNPLDIAHRIAIVVGVTAVIAVFSAIGGKANARLIATLAILKIAAITMLIVSGLPLVSVDHLLPTNSLSLGQIGSASVLALFCIAGFEMLSIPAAEVANPQRDVPRALFIALVAGVTVLVASNFLAIALVPDLQHSKLALADAARVALGQPGWQMIAWAAVLAAIGNNAGSLLACSRLLQGLAHFGDVPQWLGARSAHHSYPIASVLVSAVVIIALSLSGTFVWLIGLAGGARVLVYAGVAISAARLRTMDPSPDVSPPRFRTPMPRTVLVASLLGSVSILFALTRVQLLTIATGLVIGALVHLAYVRWKPHSVLRDAAPEA